MPILWKGETLDSFNASRGLRQGDPLSPYHSVLFMEVLSQKIHKAVEKRAWTGIRSARGCRWSPISFLQMISSSWGSFKETC